MMYCFRQTKTRERHRDIYAQYELILKQYGKDAPYLDKGYLYEQVAEICRCSSEHVRRVVHEMLKSHDSK